MIEILIIIILVFLFLIYTKINSLSEIFEDIEEKKRRRMNFENWLYADLKDIRRSISELSDVATLENPAWGVNSAFAKKKVNLIKLTAKDLIEREKMSEDDAHLKAVFLVNSFDEIDNLISDRCRDIKFKENAKSEADFRSSDFFKKEVQYAMEKLKPQYVYESIYFLITKNKIKIGTELYENTKRAFRSHSPWYGYNEFIEGVAVITELEKLGLIKKTTEWAIQGRFNYELLQDDLLKIRSIIFKGENGVEDEYLSTKKIDNDDLPITTEFL
jgi:predicted transcriptional regulator